jgi:[acyl-carrier-protein] S-malonyltransferase
MSEIVFLFPGQGSQYVGMGKDLFDAYACVRRLFEDASDLLKKDFKTLCFEGPEAALVQTDNVQPAITLINLACLQVLREEGILPAATAGHSLGEYSALAAAGVFSFADVMRLVSFRGAVMKQAADRHPGGMMAVFGLPMEALLAICDEIQETGSVELANHNSPLQSVLTGEKEVLQKAAQLAKPKGAKLIVPLKVSGAWHSRLMLEAKERIKEALKKYPIAPPSFPVVSNLTADFYSDDPSKIRDSLSEQIVRPVLWCNSITRMINDGRRLFLEVGPGKVLTGLMKDISRETRMFNVENCTTLAKFRAYLTESAAG